MLSVGGVFQGKLKELCCAQGGVDSVLGSDGQTQHLGDALCFAALPVSFDYLQVPRVLDPLHPTDLKRTQRKILSAWSHGNLCI